MPETAPHDHKLDFSTKRAAHRVERMLDDAVEDSFPASDPVSLAMPHNRIESKMPPARMRPRSDDPVSSAAACWRHRHHRPAAQESGGRLRERRDALSFRRPAPLRIFAFLRCNGPAAVFRA